MNRVIFSTIGTSLLTNRINRSNPDEKDWYNQLRDMANLSIEETPEDILDIIKILKNRAIEKLAQSSIKEIREASAELNGIYGLYQEDLRKGTQDMHWLIATDTAQGKTTAKIVENFLQNKNITAQTYTPNGFSTKSTLNFSNGIDDLLIKLKQLTDGYDKVIFNLVGSFKSLQGYLNTIGMFYANEIIYIFEGEGSDLIKIPRLPIKIDQDLIEPHTVNISLIDSGIGLLPSEIQDIPEAIIGIVDEKAVLSTWGQLIWEECKLDLLSKNLLDFPYLQYLDSFRADYNCIKEKKERVKLQETLAKVSGLLKDKNGDTSILKKEGGLQYDKYTNKEDIAHFRATQGIRVSCTSSKGILILRRYGKEPEVNKNP